MSSCGCLNYLVGKDQEGLDEMREIWNLSEESDWDEARKVSLFHLGGGTNMYEQ